LKELYLGFDIRRNIWVATKEDITAIFAENLSAVDWEKAVKGFLTKKFEHADYQTALNWLMDNN